MDKTDKGLSEKNIIEAPLKVFLLTIPFLVTLFFGMWLMGIDDTKQVLIWCGYLFFCTLAVLPLGTYLFRGFGSCGFMLTQTLGIISISLFVWTLTHIKCYMFTRLFVFLAIAIIGSLCYVIKPLRDNFIREIKKPFYIEKVTLELLVFMTVLTILCYYRGFTPDINGQEKFMDYGFIMSMIRNPKLPASDMWLSGYSINYYYFGQFIWALVIKLTGIDPAVGYNIAMASSIAIPFAMSFCIGTELFEFMTVKTNHVKGIASTIFRYITGFFAGFAVTIFGNSHSFFYDPESIGNRFLNFLGDHGINVGRTDDFFYPDSTRFIGYNPDSTIRDALGNIIDEGDYTIEEFPFYSFLVSDLHAHVISMMIVLLIMGIGIAFLSRVKYPDHYEMDIVPKRISASVKKQIFRTEYKRMVTIELVSMSILLGVAQMTNFWDFLIYFIFGTMVMFLVNTRSSRVFCDISSFICFAVNVAGILLVYLYAGNMPFLHIFFQMVLLILSYLLVCFEPTALTRTSFAMSFMFTVAFIIALPFNAGFDMISNKLGKVTHTSSVFQLIILWGLHLLILAAFIIFTIIYKNYNLGKSSKAKEKQDIFDLPADGFTNPIQKFFGQRNLADVFVCGLSVVALMLIIAPEIFYVRDIYTSGYLRANTMFKFTFAAFIMLGIAVSYACIRMIWITTSRNSRSVVTLISGIVFTLCMIIIPGHYTLLGLEQRCGDTSIRSNYKGLNGIAYLSRYNSENSYIDIDGNLKSYLDAINWLNNNVEGNPVTLEVYGDSYTDYNIVSAYTGLPTVVGWQTHEWLWRFHGIVDEDTDLLISDPDYDVWDIYLDPRYNDVDIVYLTDDPEAVQYVINKYNIEYIICGNLEYNHYDYDNTYTLEKVGEIVYSSENLNIFKVDPVHGEG